MCNVSKLPMRLHFGAKALKKFLVVILHTGWLRRSGGTNVN